MYGTKIDWCDSSWKTLPKPYSLPAPRQSRHLAEIKKACLLEQA